VSKEEPNISYIIHQLTGGLAHHRLTSAMVVKRSGLGGMPATGTGWAAGEEGAPEAGQSEIPGSPSSTSEVHAVTLLMTLGFSPT